MAIVPLWDPSEGYRSAPVSRQRRLNLYIEPKSYFANTSVSGQDKTPIAVYNTHGLTLASSVFGATPIRGAWTTSPSSTYIVVGNTVYQITNSFVVTMVGTINTTSGKVSMSDNGTQLIIVDGTNGYTVVMATNVLTQIISAAFPNGANSITFYDGYFIANTGMTSGTGSQEFFWSNVFDGTTWNALQFATKEFNPDALLWVTSSHGELILWGALTIEIWTASGDARIFAPVGGSAIEWGLAAIYSVSRFMEGMIYLARNREGMFQIATLNGYTSTPVSTPEVEYDINQQTSVSGYTAYSYLYFGHHMYQINTPNKSYLYDGSSNAWSEVGSGASGNPVGRHYGEIRFNLLGIPYVTDYRNGNIYQADPNNYTDNGDPITSIMYFKHMFEPNLGFVTIDEFQIDMETGIGTATGQGQNPQIMFSVSRDGGRTYGNQRFLPMGAQGNYYNKCFALGVGCSRDFVAQISVTDPVKRVFVNPQLRVR